MSAAVQEAVEVAESFLDGELQHRLFDDGSTVVAVGVVEVVGVRSVFEDLAEFRSHENRGHDVDFACQQVATNLWVGGHVVFFVHNGQCGFHVIPGVRAQREAPFVGFPAFFAWMSVPRVGQKNAGSLGVDDAEMGRHDSIAVHVDEHHQVHPFLQGDIWFLPDEDDTRWCGRGGGGGGGGNGSRSGGGGGSGGGDHGCI